MRHYINPLTGWQQWEDLDAKGVIKTWAKARGGEWRRVPEWIPIEASLSYVPSQSFRHIRHSCGM